MRNLSLRCLASFSNLARSISNLMRASDTLLVRTVLAFEFVEDGRLACRGGGS